MHSCSSVRSPQSPMAPCRSISSGPGWRSGSWTLCAVVVDDGLRTLTSTQRQPYAGLTEPEARHVRGREATMAGQLRDQLRPDGPRRRLGGRRPWTDIQEPPTASLIQAPAVWAIERGRLRSPSPFLELTRAPSVCTMHARVSGGSSNRAKADRYRNSERRGSRRKGQARRKWVCALCPTLLRSLVITQPHAAAPTNPSRTSRFGTSRPRCGVKCTPPSCASAPPSGSSSSTR